MIALGLSSVDQKAFEAGLLESHMIRCTLRVLDMNQRILSTDDAVVASGQVDVDSTSEVTRTCLVEALDPDGRLNLDAGTPSTVGLYADRMIQVFYGVWSHSFPRWVDVPVFIGPITGLKRDGDTLSISASGKESLLTSGTALSWSWPAGTAKTTIVRNILVRLGEQFRAIPVWPDKVPHQVTMGPDDSPWKLMRSLIGSIGDSSAGQNAELIYDANGYCRARRHSGATRWTFTPTASMLEWPSLSYSTENIRNQVLVTGGDTGSGKASYSAVWNAPQDHPFSAKHLGRGGGFRYLRETIQSETVRSKAEAQRQANAEGARLLMGSVEMDFSSLPIPHLEERDVVGVNARTWEYRMQMQKFTLPLNGEAMTVGRNTTVRSALRAKGVRR